MAKKKVAFGKAEDPLESTISSNIVKTLRAVPGIFCWKQWQGMGSYKGVCDIIGVRKFTFKEINEINEDAVLRTGVPVINEVGIFWGAEIKRTEKLMPSEYQVKFIDIIRKNGGIAFHAGGTSAIDIVIDNLFLRNRFMF